MEGNATDRYNLVIISGVVPYLFARRNDFMLLEAIEHRPKNNYAYAYNRDTVHIRVRTKKDDVERVVLWYGDKYDWDTLSTETAMEKFATDSLFDYWQVQVKPPYKRLRYAFHFFSGADDIWLTESGFQHERPANCHSFFDFPFLNAVDVFEPPAWVKEAVFYQIFPERFSNGDPSNDPIDVQPWGGTPKWNNFFGGDLKGVMDRLDYLEELGVNAIYFTPVFEAPSNHKYDTKDYFKVDPHFGDNQTLKELVRQCHQRGIRVMLDAVFNHAGFHFAPFQDVLKNGEASRYKDWFHIHSFPVQTQPRPNYHTFAFVPEMPKLNTENPEVKEYLLDVARYWIEEVGIDGWRLDVANEVDHQFWREFRRTVKEANPEAYILGEIWHDAMPWLQGDQFDAVMNYPFANAVLQFFAKGEGDSKQFAHQLMKVIAMYPQHVHESMFNLLDSHDTPRLLHTCREDKDRMKLAVLFQLSYPGVPCIYYGDEVGMTGDTDPDCRRTMIWDESKQDRDLFAFYRKLIALRKTHRAWRDGGFRFIHLDCHPKMVAYERMDDENRFLFFLNTADSSIPLTLSDIPSGDWNIVWTNELVRQENHGLKVSVPPKGFLILHSTC